MSFIEKLLNLKKEGSRRNLEDFRLNEYLIPHLCFAKGKPEDGVEMSYNLYANHAFYSTYSDIYDLESQNTFVNNGRRSGVSVALWFLSMESLITSLCKIACKKEKIDFSKELSGRNVGGRLEFVFETYQMDGIALKKAGLVNRINEFLQFRNEIFHDRNFGENISFKKTMFSSQPFFSNQVDVFQALLIFLETAAALRYAIKELDLMPNISIGNNHVLIFEKLDTIYEVFLRPYFLEVLQKHNLTTQLDLDVSGFITYGENSNDYFKRGEIVSIVRHVQKEEYKHTLNTQSTNLGTDLYNQMVASYKKPNGYNGGLNFMVNWDKLYQDAQNGAL